MILDTDGQTPAAHARQDPHFARSRVLGSVRQRLVDDHQRNRERLGRDTAKVTLDGEACADAPLLRDLVDACPEPVGRRLVGRRSGAELEEDAAHVGHRLAHTGRRLFELGGSRRGIESDAASECFELQDRGSHDLRESIVDLVGPAVLLFLQQGFSRASGLELARRWIRSRDCWRGACAQGPGLALQYP